MWDLDTHSEDKSGYLPDMSEVGMTEERLRQRRSLIGASDMPIIMGDSPYKTPYQLWEEKTDKIPLIQETNFAIERGNRWEDRVRKLFSKKTAIDFQPKNFIHPDNPIHSASLDGYNFSHHEGLEIKVASMDVLKETRSGNVPQKYKAQVQWQIYVADLKKNNFYVVHVKDNPETGKEEIVDSALCVVYRDDEYIQKLINAAEAFWTFVESNTPPPLSDRDTKELRSHKARKDFAELKRVKQKLDEIKQDFREYETVYKVLQKQCIEHMDHPIVICEGVKLQRIIRKGSIDYKSIPEEDREILDKYRKEDIISYRVDLLKEDI